MPPKANPTKGILKKTSQPFTQEQQEAMNKNKADRDLKAARNAERKALQVAIHDFGLSEERAKAIREVFHKNMDGATSEELEKHAGKRHEAKAELISLFFNAGRGAQEDLFTEEREDKLPEIEPFQEQKRPGGFAIREGLEHEPNAYSGAYGVYGPWDAKLPEAEGYTREFPKH